MTSRIAMLSLEFQSQCYSISLIPRLHLKVETYNCSELIQHCLASKLQMR